MSPEVYIVAGIVLGLLFTELTGLSPGGIIVPGYIALFLNNPLEIAFTVITAVGVMLSLRLVSGFFFFFGRRRYVFCLLLGIFIKLVIEHFFSGLPVMGSRADVQIIGWLIPGIIANDMHKQGILRTLLAAAAVTAMVFLLAQGWVVFGFN